MPERERERERWCSHKKITLFPQKSKNEKQKHKTHLKLMKENGDLSAKFQTLLNA
jgi:DNA polymerase elongation subunit (family B)